MYDRRALSRSLCKDFDRHLGLVGIVSGVSSLGQKARDTREPLCPADCLNILLEDFFRHRWPLRLSRLPSCDYSAEQARRHCSDNTKNHSPRSKRHTVSLLLLLRSFVFFPAAQNTDHAVISLVARILIKLTATL